MKNRNKERGKVFERDVAKRTNGKRYPADTGGKIDVESKHLIIQCKYTKNMSHQQLETYLCETREVSGKKIPTVAHQIPPGIGKTSITMATVPLACLVSLTEKARR